MWRHLIQMLLTGESSFQNPTQKLPGREREQVLCMSDSCCQKESFNIFILFSEIDSCNNHFKGNLKAVYALNIQRCKLTAFLNNYFEW